MTVAETIQEVAAEMGIKAKDWCSYCRQPYGSELHRRRCRQDIREMRSEWSRKSKWITPPCADCGHTRTVHERTGAGQPQLASCLIDYPKRCGCKKYRAAVEKHSAGGQR